MLIREKRSSGNPPYPQITDAPVNYAGFLNFFRGGQTIDNNFEEDTPISRTIQANMLKSAVESGHLTKVKNMVMPNEFLLDITLTASGAKLIQSDLDREFCELAVKLAYQSAGEDDGELHPCVGAVVVKDGQVIATGYRGETGEGRHAEYCALRKINDDVDNVDLSRCTMYTTLEPCSQRSPKKKACADRLIKGKVARVVFGMPDKDESVYGHVSLSEAGIEIGLFPQDLTQELQTLNKDWSDTRRVKPIVPPNDTDHIAYVSYYKEGTSIQDNIWLFIRPPKNDGGFYTVEDAAKNVLAYGRTLEEISVEWRRIDAHKVSVEKLRRHNRANHSGSQISELVLASKRFDFLEGFEADVR